MLMSSYFLRVVIFTNKKIIITVAIKVWYIKFDSIIGLFQKTNFG